MITVVYTRECIKDEYASFNEPLGHEGKARQAIMMDIIRNNGWIRVRYTPRTDTWVVELKTLTREIGKLLNQFFNKVEIVCNHPSSSIRITELNSTDDMRHFVTTISNLYSSVDLAFKGGFTRFENLNDMIE